jgi:hypothetical protein
MSFWIRHGIFSALCIVLPFVAALYFDSGVAIERAQVEGASLVRVEVQGLETRLTLHAHRTVSEAVSLAQRVVAQELLAQLSRPGPGAEAALTALVEALDAAVVPGGFAWILDAEGRSVAENGQKVRSDNPRSVVGHPIFQQTQRGFALDGIWSDHGGLMLAVGAPLVDQGRAAGAVLIGWPVDAALVEKLAASIGAELSLVDGDRVLVSSLKPGLAATLASATQGAADPVSGGRLEAPLPHPASMPFLPLFTDRHADGIAYTSLSAPILDAPAQLRWVVSTRSVRGLEELGERQQSILGVMIASLLLGLLFGLVNYRSFVSPIETISAHLSELQLGRGELELPEARVGSNFRRLVRLINMTVQRVPGRSLSTMLPTASDASGVEGSRIPSRGVAPSALVAEGRSSAVTGDPQLRSSGAHVPAPSTAYPPLSVSPSPPPAAATLASAPPAMGDARGAADLLEDDGLDAVSAIAEAIASLESAGDASGLPGLAPATGARRSAASIRGGMPSVGGADVPMPLAREASLAISIDEATLPPSRVPTSMQGVRGGGSFDLGSYAGLSSGNESRAVSDDFNPEATVVAPVAEDLLARSARDDAGDGVRVFDRDKPDMTVVATVPADLLAQSAGEAPLSRGGGLDDGLDAADRAHFKDVYERFVELRKRCGEDISDLAFDRFQAKLLKNREAMMKKHQCRTVRFQVYEKDGKAALKASPVRGR